MSRDNDRGLEPEIIASSRPFFSELIAQAVASRRLKTPLATQSYLVDLLEHYMHAGNLYATGEAGSTVPGTLAEMYLTAVNAEASVKVELLKRLGDTSLYISGFFGDSLQRKLVDLDYYADMGGSAYSALAQTVNEDLVSEVYLDLARGFLNHVEVLTVISQQSLVQSAEDLLRLYTRYMTTGSKLAAEQLIEKGVFTVPLAAKAGKQ